MAPLRAGLQHLGGMDEWMGWVRYKHSTPENLFEDKEPRPTRRDLLYIYGRCISSVAALALLGNSVLDLCLGPQHFLPNTHSLLLHLRSPTWMSAHPCSQKLGGLHSEEEWLSIVAVEATDGMADGMKERRTKRRAGAVHSTLPWSSSKLDKE